jgi:peptide-methionine (R)-S-oxide reductase
MNQLTLLLAGAALVALAIIAACGTGQTADLATNPKETVMRSTDPLPAFLVTKTDEEWKKLLTPEEYATLREKATERAGTGKYDQFSEKGTYVCAACGAELFTSDTKFEAGCGWPSFYAAQAGNKVLLVQDNSLGMARTEVLCANCGSHLGHIFDDAPQTPTGERYCINSVALKFIPAKDVASKK